MVIGGTAMNIAADRLESVRKRIAIIRQVLEDPSTISEITIDGVAEKIDRVTLRQELKELEIEETALAAKVAGRSNRVFGISLR